ncbi:bifunctional methylenetetrahydrofolate dehydrogenase/methenyltetrahydrofolate cyclohydrolase FolD [Virgibacillus sp. LDC1]|jgi:methylenetetrahydrofolate dehydrogenase (NADP+) / methenyltetrahydrofolate cyclohydrolase|uniref:bifunctional methylenetetrahydrofolate dehydrogenase/methenyltetrahydrofolate cyclohydrolase FolD n=1 Tax=Paenibacillus TaxID=44249 RepID=UPI000C2806EF|nr:MULTISPECIES: bifunctional methylenetetrahydrofolate dehydrogenase/methenyltetrahydrofolate cyclohydrolase FolD [Paenibacillus]MCV4230098.1 bifunctional methylenetetrahydrofolate dehydrogenase/methenyltetrahydrofolate cyclohydrolase FolD [Virgibacillus sp. LDC1]MBT2760825.1 bifunctional methylenetetrahydrofolate dehydrogenase/methenyltetrahydrofolate cyclohydrolase FolD [Paenibacillus sp. ISL-20]MCT1397470.1 bifunctional methylenetetrahydrofolate dehydrogenase/methenyltetrahydrofolate cyclohy
MTAATIISGKQISEEIRKGIALEVEQLSKQNVRPGLAVVLVGDDPASHVYVRNKEKACQDLGFYSEVHRLSAESSQEEVLALVDKLNAQESIHGILVQLPLPKHIHEKAVIDAIAVEKDVDGFHPVNVGNLVIGDDSLLPCTPAGVIEMIKRTGIEIAGKHAVVIGRSNIVGKPVSLLLQRENATVTMCHSRTGNMAEIARQADILVVAIGRANMIDASYVKPGAVVIDVGMNRLENGKLAGDVDFESVKEVSGPITPVPGGVGPMTITMLMQNTLIAAKRLNGLS